MTATAPFRLGLTGSIGMGKSTVSSMFRDEGVPVVDADAIVHDLYKPGGAAVTPLLERFPAARAEDGGVSRPLLSKEVVGKEAAMKDLEAIVHPLVVSEREKVLAALPEDSRQLVVCDIPLLYETKGNNQVDAVAVVSCPLDVQRQRVLARPGMTADKFEAILGRQVPDETKRAMADHIIDTGQSMEDTRMQVLELIRKYSSRS